MSFEKIKENLEELYQNIGNVQESELTIINPDLMVEGIGVFFAIDHESNIHVLIQSEKNKKIVEDTKSKGIKILSHPLQSETDSYVFIDVVCFLPKLKKLFMYFIEDLISKFNPLQEDINYTCLSVLNQWRVFFEEKPTDVLRENQIIGLLAELVYLKKLLKYNPKATLFWVGPEKEKYDFYNNNIALEIKATKNREGRFTEIHGFQQLESPSQGELYLGFIKFEKTKGSGLNLPEIIQEILSITTEKQDFIDKISSIGYSYLYEEEYKEFRYLIPPDEDRLYFVDMDFPRIIHQSFKNNKIPNFVVNIKYKIDLSGEPPIPLSDIIAKEIFNKMV